METGLRRVEFLDPLTEQEVELSLGLSIGGSSCKKVTASPSITGSGGESVDPQRRREANALRGQCRERDREAREEEADQRSIQIPEIGCRPNPNPNHIPMMMPVYMPMTNGFGFPYVVPCWAPTIPSESEKNVFHPVACRSFPPFPNPNLNHNHNPNPEHISNLNPSVVFHPEKIGGKSIAIKLAPSSSDSPVSSSSGFSDYQSGSLRGRSSSSSETTRSHSSSTVAEKPKGQAIQEALSKPIIPAPAPAMVTENAARIDPMPCVSTTGPDGRRIKGFLHRYTKGEVSIVCVCHGSTFSPAAFVRHAGGTEGSHPLRQILVVPS